MRQRHQAEASFERGIELSAELGDKSLEARGLLGLGRLYESMGKSTRTKAIAAVEGAIARYKAQDLKRELEERKSVGEGKSGEERGGVGGERRGKKKRKIVKG